MKYEYDWDKIEEQSLKEKIKFIEAWIKVSKRKDKIFKIFKNGRII